MKKKSPETITNNKGIELRVGEEVEVRNKNGTRRLGYVVGILRESREVYVALPEPVSMHVRKLPVDEIDGMRLLK